MVRVADDLHGPLMICSGIVGSLDNNPTVLEFKFEISSRIIRGGVTPDTDFHVVVEKPTPRPLGPNPLPSLAWSVGTGPAPSMD